jgi:hypothetical protein
MSSSIPTDLRQDYQWYAVFNAEPADIHPGSAGGRAAAENPRLCGLIRRHRRAAYETAQSARNQIKPR